MQIAEAWKISSHLDWQLPSKLTASVMFSFKEVLRAELTGVGVDGFSQALCYSVWDVIFWEV